MKVNSPLISVAMPVYNGAKYLPIAVESILNQSYSNFEFIIIDDGSSDESLEVLKKFSNLDSRIKLISRPNKGFSATVNEIIDIARGEWIARMDQDDIAHPNRFERQLQWLNSTGADICGTWVQLFGHESRLLKHAVHDDAIKLELLFDCAFAHPSVFIRKSVVKSLRYDPSWDKAEDYELWTRIAVAGYKMTNIPEVLLDYRVHATQISTASASIQKMLTKKIRVAYWLDYFKSIGVREADVVDIASIREHDSALNMKNIYLASDLAMLSSKSLEARAIVWENVTKLYFRCVMIKSTVLLNWFSLAIKHPVKTHFGTFIKMAVATLLPLRFGILLVRYAKKSYY